MSFQSHTDEAMTLEVIFQQSSTLEMLSSIINSEVDTALKDSLRKVNIIQNHC